MRKILVAIFMSVLAGGSTAVAAQDKIPTLSDRAVAIISGSGPGSGIDTMLRNYIEIASKYTDQTFVIEHRTGGAGLVAFGHFLRQPADGMTLMGFTRSSAISHLTQPDFKDPLNEIHYIGVVMFAPLALFTYKDGPYKDGKEMIEWGKAHPGEQKWGGPYVGSVDWLMTLLSWEGLGYEGVYIPHDDGASLAAAVMGKHLPIGTGDMGDVVSRADRLKGLIVASAERDPRLPDVSTFKELGYDIVERNFRGLVARKGLSQAAIGFHDQVYTKVMADPKWAEFVDSQLAQPAGGVKGEEMAELATSSAEAATRYLKKPGLLQ